MTATESATQLDELCINTIRTLSMDAVQKANSGHPGAPMASRARRLHALHANHATQPERSGVDQPGPLRALRGPRLDAPVLDAVPDRLSADARGHRALPAGRLADSRPSGAQVLARDRGDDRSTRSGRSRCRSGSRSASGCWRRASTATARTSSTTTRSRSRPTATCRRACPPRRRRSPATGASAG